MTTLIRIEGIIMNEIVSLLTPKVSESIRGIFFDIVIIEFLKINSQFKKVFPTKFKSN